MEATNQLVLFYVDYSDPNVDFEHLKEKRVNSESIDLTLC